MPPTIAEALFESPPDDAYAGLGPAGSLAGATARAGVSAFPPEPSRIAA